MKKFAFWGGALCICVAGLTACSGDDSEADSEELVVSGFSLMPESAGEDAVPVADQLWQELKDVYPSWELYPGTTEKQEGASPHGMNVTIRYSGGDPAAPSDGLIVLKENFGEGGELGAVTVMRRVADFDPDNEDWFYAKYLPDGSLDQTPDGMPLAGAVEPEPGAACRGCHRSAPGDDFLHLDAN